MHHILIDLAYLKCKNLHYVNLMKVKGHAELINFIDPEGMGYTPKSKQ